MELFYADDLQKQRNCCKKSYGNKEGHGSNAWFQEGEFSMILGLTYLHTNSMTEIILKYYYVIFNLD